MFNLERILGECQNEENNGSIWIYIWSKLLLQHVLKSASMLQIYYTFEIGKGLLILGSNNNLQIVIRFIKYSYFAVSFHVRCRVNLVLFANVYRALFARKRKFIHLFNIHSFIHSFNNCIFRRYKNRINNLLIKIDKLVLNNKNLHMNSII